MTTIAIFLPDAFADWEAAHLASAARSYMKQQVRYATLDGAPVTSAGGLRVTPDAALGDLPRADALVLVGSDSWAGDAAPDLAAHLATARRNGTLIAGICGATLALARAGLLDHVRHTSNSADFLASTGYAGASRYVDTPAPVRDDGIVTAPGTAPVTFMVETLTALGLDGPELDHYATLLGAEFAPKAAAA